MSTTTEQAADRGRPEEVEDGFFSRNAWIKPFLFVEGAFVAMLILLDIANDVFPSIRGGFSQAIFGMILAIIFLSAAAAIVTLILSGIKQLTQS
ncbi:hypothetical protein [Haloarchaeobius sp. TZWWS8]|uniref:hypothetical protein n=1 Tax=Haloarchaeobius sp. TZWWS8 TaxID=3446121 RepID=UPI003EB992C5